MSIVFKDVFLSQKEYTQVCLRLLSKKSRWNTIRVVFFLLLSILSWGAFIFFKQTRDEVLHGDAWGTVFLMLIGPIFPYSYWKIYSRSYNSTAFLREPASYTISEAGIQVDSPLVHSQASWQTVTQLYLFPPYAVLMNSNTTGYFFDFRCLVSPATEADFVALATQHGIAVK